VSRRVLFLPGAAGSATFWAPVARRLPEEWDKRRLSWPGLGAEPNDPSIDGLDDLVQLTLDHLDGPTDLVAQSMGGLVALKSVLAAPVRVRRLVLTATSGGLPMENLGACDWRADYRALFPDAPHWITNTREDLSDGLGEITCPVLLLFGDTDPISPPAVGERLKALLPNATLVIMPGGHDRPDEAARLIAAHLA
jgi:pimeloyl-ACP methyl ester carboxylesterase